MRILVVEPDLVDNGALRVSLERAGLWAGLGDDVTLLVLQQVRDGSTTAQPAAGLNVRFAAHKTRNRYAVLVAGLLRAIFLARRADVVVAGREIHYGLLIAWLAARLTRRPYSVLVQSRVDTALAVYVSRRLRRLTVRALIGADQAVCVSAGLVPTVTRLGLPADRVEVVHNAIDRDRIVAAARHTPALEMRADELHVVGTGRLVPQKGFDLLLRAHAAVLRRGGPTHRLVLQGDGPERGNLERLADELGVRGSVAFAGHVTNPHPVVARADLLVSSSRWEGFSLVLLEALACGTPCIAFDCIAGPSEVLGDGEFGRLVPAEDVEALAGEIADHLRDPSTLTASAQRGGEPGRDMFQPIAMAVLHRDLLARLTGPGAR